MRLALFGGTFDPIHSAHVSVARQAADAFSLDRVLLIPAGNPPHKQGQQRTDWSHRFRMVELACAGSGDARLEPSRLEEGAARSYSIETIARVRAAHPGDQIFFLIGADAFSEIETWHRWREVLEQVEFIVVSRPGHNYDVPAGARIHRLETLALNVSSSAIRGALQGGRLPAELPPAVAAYIRQAGLYAR